MNHKLKTAVFVVLLAILVAPAVQQYTGIFSYRPLNGQQDPATWPEFTLKDWFADRFQPRFNKATEEHVGFRPVLIRMKNELEYRLYRKANASGVVVGKKGYLFENDYIRSYTGRDYLGDYYWDQKFRRLKKVSDTLAAKGVRVLIVLEPGKASFHPEYIPSRYLGFQKQQNNYGAIVERAERTGIPLLDLNRFFAEKKPTAAFPLFPKGGIHWSTGGMVVASDTLLGFLRSRMGSDVPRLIIDRVEVSDSLRDTDGDLVEIMNLVREPEHPRMGYPVFRFEQRDSIRKPRVLAISDSYYFNFLNAKIPAGAFANEAFWYYSKSIYPDSWSAPKDTASVNIPEVVEGMDLVMIMVTERFYHKFDWDFTDVLFRHYYPNEPPEYRYDYLRDIIRNYVWFDDIQLQADYSGRPVEEKLAGNADYLFWQDDQAGKLPHDEAYYRMNILKDAAWMKQIREKAAANGITVDEQIGRDARWMMEQGSR